VFNLSASEVVTSVLVAFRLNLSSVSFLVKAFDEFTFRFSLSSVSVLVEMFDEFAFRFSLTSASVLVKHLSCLLLGLLCW
jgi:hypothetical protein